MSTYLEIDAEPGEIRVLASPLELQNRKTVSDAKAHNVRLYGEKQDRARNAFRQEAEVAVECPLI
jgi:hypothetical protein